MPVTSKHPLYEDYIRDWEDCRNFFEGERHVKEMGVRYLPKPEQATASEYQAYVQRAFFFPAVDRTVAGLSGAIDRKAPTFTLTPRTAYLELDADGNRASLRQFSKSALDECFITGRFGVLVDRPTNGGDPYLALYSAEDIINWIDGPDGLELVVLRETYFEAQNNDPFVQTRKTQYRVLRLDEGRYRQELYTANTAGGADAGQIYTMADDVTPSQAGRPLDFIPFVFGNVRSTTATIDKPPLLDLVLKNAEHYRVSADYANALYFTGNPILWVKGVKRPRADRPPTGDPNDVPFKLALGSQRAVYLPSSEAQIGLTECSGHGVSPNHDKAEDIKKEMAVLGARLLEQQRTGVEAAETVYLRQSGESSTLSNIVLSVSSAMRRALEMADIWQGGNGTEITFELNTDFVDTVINPQLVSTLADLVTKEYISWDTFFYNLACGELIPPGVTADEERQKIESQPPMTTPAMSDLMQGLFQRDRVQEQADTGDGQDR